MQRLGMGHQRPAASAGPRNIYTDSAPCRTAPTRGSSQRILRPQVPKQEEADPGPSEAEPARATRPTKAVAAEMPGRLAQDAQAAAAKFLQEERDIPAESPKAVRIQAGEDLSTGGESPIPLGPLTGLEESSLEPSPGSRARVTEGERVQGGGVRPTLVIDYQEEDSQSHEEGMIEEEGWTLVLSRMVRPIAGRGRGVNKGKDNGDF
ncbi:uncharacterized protein LOC113544511 [Pangasianodon hypophthalmus]|uniref:uncharacterized protein LOC113544511 n=1 Tax=Pangasianodon hypophthalmus TaxID=310915 RepID=UPI000EFDBFC8|nr:uncharacterized protein LOC113544511 [Pangasianodon hypophthalmus]